MSTRTPAHTGGDESTDPALSVFCDESWHTTYGATHMTVGAIICPLPDVRPCAEAVRTLKAKHRLKPDFEVKWTKVSPAKEDFYMELVDLFLRLDHLRFSGATVETGPGSREGGRVSREGIHEALGRWLLSAVIRGPYRYRVYLDVNDTRGGARLQRLREAAAAGPSASDRPHVERIQQIRSRESGMMQMADVLTGALAYANRGLGGNAGKTAVVARLRDWLGTGMLTDASAAHDPKFNVVMWRP